MPRGGKRPGAGARPGNLNALKHGRYSKQFALIGALLAQDPRTRQALIDISNKHSMKQTRASAVAATLFTNLLNRARDTARRAGSSNLLAHIDESDSIKALLNESPYEQAPRPGRKQKETKGPSNAPHEPQEPSNTRYENPLIEPTVSE